MPDKYWKPSVNSSGQVSWSLTDSTTAPASQNIKGPSPVKGTDYFTAAEKAEMVSDLVSEIQSSKLETKTVTANGTYTLSSGKIGFSSVNVNVSGGAPVIQSKSITENGTYTAPSGVDGFSPVTVNVPTGPAKSSSDVTVSGRTVTVPAGLYSAQVQKSVAQGTAGTPTASKGAVSNHSMQITPSVTNTEGYITGGTKNGTPVTVSASELVSGSETKTANGTYDVTNLEQLVVNVPGSAGQTFSGVATFTNITTGWYDAHYMINDCPFVPDAIILYGDRDTANQTQNAGVLYFNSADTLLPYTRVYRSRSNPTSKYDTLIGFFDTSTTPAKAVLALTLLTNTGTTVARSSADINFVAVKWT